MLGSRSAAMPIPMCIILYHRGAGAREVETVMPPASVNLMAFSTKFKKSRIRAVAITSDCQAGARDSPE